VRVSLPEDDAYDYAEDRRATELPDDDARIEKTQVVEQRLGTWGVDNRVEPNW
jgi:hypothetical protein